MRTVEELLDVDDPAWSLLAQELAGAAVPLQVLPVDEERGQHCLYRLQVTARSRLGALALHTGGVLVEYGWLRVLGGGTPGLPSLAEANDLSSDGYNLASLLVGFDVLGGRFEINGPDPAALQRQGGVGEMCYFAPDTLRWEPLGMGHGEWLSWIAAGRTQDFYASLRWPGWESEVQTLPAEQGLSVYPLLFSKEAHDDLAATSRRAVPIEELFALHRELAWQLGRARGDDPAEADQ